LKFLCGLTHEAPLARRVVGRRPLLVALSPAVVREVLVTRRRELVKENVVNARRYGGAVSKPGLLTSNQPERHEAGRRLLRPLFGPEQIRERVEPLVRDASARLVATWSERTEVDPGRELIPATMEIAAKSLFGVDIRDAPAAADDLRAVLGEFQLVTSPATAARATLRIRRGLAFTAAWARLAELAAELAAGPGQVAEALRTADLGPAEIAAEARGILLAGAETTSTALTWALIELGRNPGLASALAEEGEPLAERIFAETLRLYPPAWYIGRLAVVDTELAGEPVPAGSMVLVSPYLLHRDADHYDDPAAFNPDRWRNGTAGRARAFTYVPFGAGSRRCIGEEIAWLEGRVILATLARSLEFDLPPGQDLTPFPGASLRPAGRVQLRVRPRDGRARARAAS
jgi:cytochrome P450